MLCGFQKQPGFLILHPSELIFPLRCMETLSPGGGYAFGAGSPVFNTLTEAEKKSFGLEIISRDFLEMGGTWGKEIRL